MGPSRSQIGLLLAGVATLVVGWQVTPSSRAAEIAKAVPGAEIKAVAADFDKLLDDTKKVLDDAVKSQGNFNMKSKYNAKARNIEGEAYVLLIYAEAAEANGDAKAANLRDAALGLLDAVKKQSFDEAKKHVAAVGAWKMANAGGPKPMPLNKAVPLKNLMLQVRDTNRALEDHRRLSPAEWKVPAKADRVVLDTQRMAMLTLGMTAHTPDKDPDAKKGMTTKLWADSSAEVRKHTIDMVAAAKKADPAAFKTAFNAMDKACTSCHDKFRPEDP